MCRLLPQATGAAAGPPAGWSHGSLSALGVPVGVVWQPGVDYMSLARLLAGKGLVGKKAQGMAQLVRLGGEKRSHVARPVSFQQDLIKASNTVGRGSRAGVSVAQRRLSAVKPDRALRQRSDGQDSGLFLGCLDGTAPGAAHGELEAGEDHQLPLKAVNTHSCVGQGQSQGPEAGYCALEPGLSRGQRTGARGAGSVR